MGWITELLGSENAKPVWGKIATALDYVIGDLATVIRTAAIVGCIYFAIAYTRLVNKVNADYITPREHGAVIADNMNLRKENDSLSITMNNERKFYNQEAFRWIDIQKIKDSTIQELRFVIKGYEREIQKAIK